MQLETVTSKETNKIELNPFLFERVIVAKAESEDELLAMPGWCACAGTCNCFCGSCAACSVAPNPN